MPELPIRPSARDFREMFSRKTFRVPPYQRAYDWKDEQVSDFARDIDAVVDSRLDGGGPSPHFFGAVISIFDQETEFEVVDGQQRLTTHMLCLKELRDRWLELAEATRGRRPAINRVARDRAEEVHKVIFTRNEPRLVLSRRDKDFFADILTGAATGVRRGEHQSHRRLWEACQTLRKDLFDPLLANVTHFAKRQQKLQAIQDALLEDSYVVHLNTTDGDQAYRFFMVLNDRGKPLSAGDLLRTFTLAVLEEYPPQQQAAERDWDAILRRSEAFVNRFLGAYYISHVGTRVPTGEMYDRFRKQFLEDEVDSPESATALREKIGELRAEAEVFAMITNGDWPYEEAHKPLWEQDRLRRLVKSLGHRLADPLLLVVAREANETTFRDLVRMLEPFAFRYINIVNASASRLETLYFKHAKKARGSSHLDKGELRKELRNLLKTYAPDQAFLALLPEQLRFSNKTTSKKLIKHFLTTLEDYEDWFREGASGRPKIKDRTTMRDLDTVNIEHIYPQNPRSPNPLLDPLKNTLGNLTLMDQDEGTVAGNDEFPQKKRIYARSEFKITKPLGRLRSNWNEAAVAKRVDFYKERAAKIFVVN